MHATERMPKVARGMSGMDSRRNVGTGRRCHGEVCRYDESEPELCAGKLPALDLIVDDNVVWVISECRRLVPKGTQAFEKNLNASLHRASLGNRRRAGRDNLKTLAVVELDRLVAFALVADAMMPLNMDQVVRRRVFLS